MKPEEFEAFVAENQHSLINYVTHLTRSRERAEEIAQDAFVRFYRNMERCRDDERLTPYLFRIATNLVVTQIRREQRWKRILPLLTVSQPRSAPPSDRPLMTDEIQRKVTAALEQLPLKFRAPLVLFEIEEWSYDAIARALDCRIGTVKSRISRARKLMRVQLESWWIGGNDDGRTGWQGPAATAANSGIATLQV
ncbi:MAG: RNA polymerase sigma factor [Acidobacteriota bacterium]|nr:RNA polymerase sigma factor [Acidobacteriota bacterium]